MQKASIDQKIHPKKKTEVDSEHFSNEQKKKTNKSPVVLLRHIRHDDRTRDVEHLEFLIAYFAFDRCVFFVQFYDAHKRATEMDGCAWLGAEIENTKTIL